MFYMHKLKRVGLLSQFQQHNTKQLQID